jgi:hypothetical protein
MRRHQTKEKDLWTISTNLRDGRQRHNGMQRQIDNNQRSAVNAAEQNSHTPRNHSLASGLHQTALKNAS